ncbi:DUF2199 domain-containing protein [Tabrizicola sp.]|uniref:DUF2199 domain-containing protein n=1 Tax=Tabrizicola sp. TaxID=2005166 RepID=UPI00273693AF|nr:DUF2199 domain-containing protein [Tabrizicola sp.]MDP3196392.1 DUF2199 domain-containing protein [Tabrizicola sp.]
MALAPDRRWQPFTDTKCRCPCCGKPVQGVLDLGYDHSDTWPHLSHRMNGGTVTVGQDKLTADFCSVADLFYLRGLQSLPIRGTDAALAFGAWAEVPTEPSHANRAVVGTPAETALGTRPARLANTLSGFPGSAGLTPTSRFLDAAERPQFTVADPSALGVAQQDAFSVDIYASFAHDLRPHLGVA